MKVSFTIDFFTISVFVGGQWKTCQTIDTPRTGRGLGNMETEHGYNEAEYEGIQ